MASSLLSTSIFSNSAANSRTSSPRTNSNVPLPRGGGILLNPLTPLALPGTSSPSTHSPRPNTSLSLAPNSTTSEYASSFSSSPHPRSATSPLPRSDSSSSSQSETNNSNGNATQNGNSHSRANSIRKIRFAPLPDPRREELAENVYTTDSPLIGAPGGLTLPSDEGVSLVQQQQLPTTTNTSSALGLVHSAGDQPAAGTLLLPAGAQGANVDESAIPDETASDYGSSTSALRRDNTVSKPKRWSQRLFGPLLGKTTSGGGSGPGSPMSFDGGRGAQSEDESMWRTASRDSMASNTSNEGGMLAGLALTRRRTASGADSRPSKLSLGFGGGGGVPMKRVQSLGTPVSKGPLAPAPRRRNQRMLNGRVYGAPRSRPFDNVQDTEPEFVEWGHGGAGSVKNAGLAGGKYAGIQSQGNVSVGATAGGSVADDDDGSGMAWVKRRREQREREKAEAEKKAAEAKEDTTNSSPNAVAESESNVTIQARDFVAKDGQLVEDPEAVDLSSVPITTSGSSNVTPRPSGTPTGVGTPRRKDSGMTITNVGSPLSNELTINVAEDEHHVVKAVAVPAHHHHHHHSHVQHPHSANEPGRKSPPPPTGATPSEASSVTGDDEDDDDSDSSSSDDEDTQEEQDSDTEEEMAEREENRKTSLCAGVEKISRHRDQQVPGC